MFNKYWVRFFSSALYITGDKAQTNFAVLTPVIDFDAQLKQKQELVKNVKVRELSIDIDKVEECWNFFKEIDERKRILEETRIKLGQAIAKLPTESNDENTKAKIEKLRLHIKIVKEDFKSVRDMSYGVEEGAALQVLGLPNMLHPKTPHNMEVIVFRYLDKTDVKTKSHITLGDAKNYFKYINSMSCYLKSDAGLFEFAMQNFFNDKLLDSKFVQFSNSDFVKSIVVEGCGTDPRNSEVLNLEEIHCIKHDDINRLHLVGASSLYSFMAYFTKHLVQPTQLPIRAFCSGRKYRTVKESGRSLFNLNQTSDVGLFTATLDDMDVLDNIIDEIASLYKSLGYHFQLVLLPANKLNKSESLRISIQMFSNYLSDYVEVGHVSFYEEYISKRLLFSYTVNKERKYPKIVAGSLVNIQKVLGCVIENNSIEKRPLLSDILCKYL